METGPAFPQMGGKPADPEVNFNLVSAVLISVWAVMISPHSDNGMGRMKINVLYHRLLFLQK